MKECLWCKEPFEQKKETKKFCSTSCRVMFNKKFGKKDEIKPFQMQVLYNQILEVVEKMNNNSPTIQNKVIYAPAPVINVGYTTEQVEKPNLSLFGGYKMELKDAKTISEVEKIMSRIKIEPNLLPNEKKTLESYAKDVSKEMYND